MRRFLLLLAIAACARPAEAPSLSEAHRAAIVDSVGTMLTAWQAALGARDATLLGAYYARDPRFRWIEDGAVRYTSAAQVVEAYRDMLGSVRALSLTLDAPAITPLAPGVAVVTTGFAQKVTDTTGSITGFAGALTMTVIHGDSGWQFLAGHTSSVVPRAAPAPALKRN